MWKKPLNLILASLLGPTIVFGQRHDTKLDSLAADLKVVQRIAEVAAELDDSRQVLLALIDGQIETLREPRGDGTYRLARLQREEESRVTEEKGVEKVSTEAMLQSISVSAPRAYHLQVIVPQKRNVISANNRVYLKSATVAWTSFDGKSTTTELPVDVWVNPGDAHAIALPAIARSAKATVTLGVDSGNKKAVAQVALLQARLVDDAASPYFPAVHRLADLRRRASEENIRRGDFKTAVDEALLALPGELDRRLASQQAEHDRRSALVAAGTRAGTIKTGDATPDVIAEIVTASQLLQGAVADQARGRALLQELIEKLAPSGSSR